MGHVFTYLILILVVLFSLPLVWMVSIFKPMSGINFSDTARCSLDNHSEMMNSFIFFKYAGNTLFITVFVVAGNIISGPLLLMDLLK